MFCTDVALSFQEILMSSVTASCINTEPEMWWNYSDDSSWQLARKRQADLLLWTCESLLILRYYFLSASFSLMATANDFIRSAGPHVAQSPDVSDTVGFILITFHACKSSVQLVLLVKEQILSVIQRSGCHGDHLQNACMTFPRGSARYLFSHPGRQSFTTHMTWDIEIKCYIRHT